jgi:hypothetical protein
MTRTRLAAVLVAALIGLLVVLLAQDVRSWRDRLHDDALQYSAFPSAEVRLTAPTVLPSSVSEGLLSVGRDREWLKALQTFTVAYQTTENLDGLGPGAYRLLHTAEGGLATVTQDPDPVRASQAYNLLATLLLREAYPGTGVDPTFVQQSLTNLQNAVRLDQADEPAKENLELAYRVLLAQHGSIEKKRGTGTRATKKRRGAYGGPPGEGY